MSFDQAFGAFIFGRREKPTEDKPTGEKRTMSSLESLQEEKRKLEETLRSTRQQLAATNSNIAKHTKLSAFKDRFTSALSEDSCCLCQVSFVDNVQKVEQGIVSYRCNCTRVRIVHKSCWSHSFNCCCGVTIVW